MMIRGYTCLNCGLFAVEGYTHCCESLRITPSPMRSANVLSFPVSQLDVKDEESEVVV